MGPKSKDRCSYKRQKKSNHGKKEAVWSDAATSQRMLEPQKLEKAKNRFFHRRFRGSTVP